MALTTHLSTIAPFWQGVIGTLLTTGLLSGAVRLYRLQLAYSRRSDERSRRLQAAMNAKLASPDPAIRVEGYVMALFSLVSFFIAAVAACEVAMLLSSVGYVAPAALSYVLSALCLGLCLWTVDRVVIPNEIVIFSATYGEGTASADVTASVRSQIYNDRLHIHVDDNLTGGPSPGNAKELVVVFARRGSRKTRSVRQGDFLSIP